MGPTLSPQVQSLSPAPRTRPAPISRVRRPPPVTSEPTPIDSIDSPAKPDLTDKQARPTRTYFTPRRATALYPSGHGLHIAVTEKFLDELIRVESQAAGPVRDCILGAEVLGSQQTETSLHVRMIPSADQAQLELLLTGVTRNSTENRTPQAVIQSDGNHRFEVSKSVQFDGTTLLTRSPAATMYPCQRNKAALTPASAIPILGPLVSEFALGVAEQSRPAAERITAQRITEQVVPQFNRSVDRRLAELNTQLQSVLPKQLPLLGISAPTTRVRTTEQQLTASFAWDTVRDCPEYVPPLTTSDAAELRVAIHSEAVNIWLASLPLGGLEIPVSNLDRWQKELERALSSSESVLPGTVVVSRVGQSRRLRTRTVADDSTDAPIWTPPMIVGPILPVPPVLVKPERVDRLPTLADPDAGTNASESLADQDSQVASQSQMILAPEHPLTVEFVQGEAVITLVAAFRIAPAPPTDYHRIRIPVTSRLVRDELTLTPGQVQVETTATAPGPLSELTRAAIEQQIQQRLQPTRWPVERSFPREDGGPITLRLGELSSSAGWLSLVWGVESPTVKAVAAP